ncbi:DUF1178 family protein [Dongia sp.]|uniref:DUF1178 family protein n=1 Tax=Dongia sp. TaxID=1977262 RepID=UPI0037538FF3
MILYELNCDRQHSFEAWFKDGATADRQLKKKTVECPSCGSVKVAKALMAPRVGKKSNSRALAPVETPAAPSVPAPAPKAAMIPAELRQALLEVRKSIEANCDYVGDKFAEEARKIHEGESEARGIYGEATDAEHEELIEDGIEVARVPWVNRGDA